MGSLDTDAAQLKTLEGLLDTHAFQCTYDSISHLIEHKGDTKLVWTAPRGFPALSCRALTIEGRSLSLRERCRSTRSSTCK